MMFTDPVKDEFQSALPRGERRATSSVRLLMLIFQSALPRGERRCSEEYCAFRKLYFNPRSREGSDMPPASRKINPILFQSALPRGERHSLTAGFCNTTHFNPRSREGSDFVKSTSVNPMLISIRAPARGATDCRIGEQSHLPGFQSALPRGERLKKQITRRYFPRFQSALPRGERHG